MTPISRRQLLASGAAAAAGCLAGPAAAADKPSPVRPSAAGRIAMIHVSDLFRPHEDPDDHWDLATVYALANMGRVDLLGVLIDYPAQKKRRDPDVMAVAQMNYLTGKAVPVMVGSPRFLSVVEAATPENREATGGVRTMLEILRAADRKVVITVVGCCRDVALAGRLEPALFAEKCAAVYLNAGMGKSTTKRREYNVTLDPASYAAIFDLSCPVYWAPCFEERPAIETTSYGTVYSFRQAEVLPRLSPRVQNYFAYMYLHGQSEADRRKKTAAPCADWLQYLLGTPDAELLGHQGGLDRNMWSTGGFLHAAGLAVSADGKVLPRDEVPEPVFTFDPIDVRCRPDGIATWSPAAGTANRYVFHVRDLERYRSAMTAALRSVVASLP
jgi:hypothetical protein